MIHGFKTSLFMSFPLSCVKPPMVRTPTLQGAGSPTKPCMATASPTTSPAWRSSGRAASTSCAVSKLCDGKMFRNHHDSY